jgi:hypothetical protein
MLTLWRRIQAAAAILFLPGDHTPVTKRDLVQLRVEWQLWEVTFTDALEKLNAWAARQAKRDKRALTKLAEADASEDGTSASSPTDRHARKLALWRKAGGAHAPSAPPSRTVGANE